MRAIVYAAWVNTIPQWRVYYDQELLATFDNEYAARLYANYLNENY